MENVQIIIVAIMFLIYIIYICALCGQCNLHSVAFDTNNCIKCIRNYWTHLLYVLGISTIYVAYLL